MARRHVGARLLLLAQFTQALRVTRRSLAGVAGAAIPAAAANAVRPPDFVTQQPGFTPTKSGLQIKDVKEGTGAAAATGDRVVYEWEGYTIGYFCLLYTSDAADDTPCVDLGGRRIIKKKK